MSDDLSIPNPGYRGTRGRRYGIAESRVRRGLDPDTRRLAIFAIGVGAVLVALIAGSAVMRHRSTEIPVIAADSRPIRVKPDNPGGMKIDGAENDVFTAGSDTADSKLAPPAEDPDAKALRSASAPPAVDSEPLAAPVTSKLPPTASTPPATASTPSVIAMTPTALPRPAPEVSMAAARPAPAVAARPAPMPGDKSAAAEVHPTGSGHAVMVQLAALTSEQAARNEWLLLSKRLPELLNGKQPDFSRTERDGHTFWRVRTSGFADLPQAHSFCDHVRAKGGGCSVADF